ncbi:hypothetical protein SDC9_120192 [bioreactor metagenome]|uniref:Uncharacterized protein n=1 Tax=bioreactor metagenome TaxID=1076179 RepID=A0A645C605_9ZZZZ
MFCQQPEHFLVEFIREPLAFHGHYRAAFQLGFILLFSKDVIGHYRYSAVLARFALQEVQRAGLQYRFELRPAAAEDHHVDGAAVVLEYGGAVRVAGGLAEFFRDA